ncbi:MAG: right-handed parallel beta-helix repeat-containing protein [Microscillaceae bacterium]|nr:right-handed parallel beta-helix repeat-containing protein [Microscillaceae bacterium]
MRKLCLFFFLFLAFSTSAFAQGKTVPVKNATEFLAALGSDRTIMLEYGVYDFSTTAQESGTSYQYNEVYDGLELHVSGLKNLTIKSKDANRPAELLTQPAYGNVIVFMDCENIRIENIEAGHGATKGSCVGGVFKMINSKNFTINNCLLYGSGIEGITTENLDGLTCTKTDIRGCTYGVMSLLNSKNILFDQCKMYENKEYNLFLFNNCQNVRFKNTVISHNMTGTEEYSTYPLFELEGGSAPIILEDCVIKYNTCNYLSTKESSLKMTRCELRDNYITKGEYKE